MLAVKRKVIEAALVIVFFLLETTIFSYLELASIDTRSARIEVAGARGSGHETHA